MNGMDIHEYFSNYVYYVWLVGLLLEYIALPVFFILGEPTLALLRDFLGTKGDLSLPI